MADDLVPLDMTGKQGGVALRNRGHAIAENPLASRNPLPKRASIVFNYSLKTGRSRPAARRERKCCVSWVAMVGDRISSPTSMFRW